MCNHPKVLVVRCRCGQVYSGATECPKCSTPAADIPAFTSDQRAMKEVLLEDQPYASLQEAEQAVYKLSGDGHTKRRLLATLRGSTRMVNNA